MQRENLWAPWRMAYIRGLDGGAIGESAPALVSKESAPVKAAQECFLCAAMRTTPATPEAIRALVLHRTDHSLLMLNRYPYTNGHLLVAPREHVAELTDLTPIARADLMELTAVAQRLLQTALQAQGINIGMNLGRCAGAGLPGHLHVHAVPRWNGDTNFMDVVGAVRVVPDALERTQEYLAQVLGDILQLK